MKLHQCDPKVGTNLLDSDVKIDICFTVCDAAAGEAMSCFLWGTPKNTLGSL